MSKEKLEDIKDKYAKVNYDNGESHATSWQELLDNDLSFDNEDIDALMKLAYNQALEDISSRLSEVQGREGCTYGDTDFDSLSAAYGYNEAIEHTKQSILKLKI